MPADNCLNCRSHRRHVVVELFNNVRVAHLTYLNFPAHYYASVGLGPLQLTTVVRHAYEVILNITILIVGVYNIT